MPRRVLPEIRPKPSTFPARFGIIDTSVDATMVKPHRVRHVKDDPLSCVGHEGKKRFRSGAGRDGNVSAEPQHIELVYPVVIDHLGADVLGRAFEFRPGRSVQRPALRAVLAGRRGTAENLTFAPVEA